MNNLERVYQLPHGMPSLPLRCDLSEIKSNSLFYMSHSFTGTMNSTNWSAPKRWVYIAQWVDHCTANAEAMGLNPVEALKTFFGLTLWLLKLQLQLRWSHLHFIGTSLCLQYKPCSTIVKYFFRKRKTWFYIWFYFTLFYLLL